MKGTAMRLLPTIACLKIGTAKNSSISHVNEISLIKLIFLQGIQIYAQNRHASPETLTAKKQCHENVMSRKKLIGIVSSKDQ
jgi:hypothetical protein